MSRVLTIGAAQQGPVTRDESRADVVERLLGLLRQGHAMGCDLVVFTEVALVPFFPHWHMTDEKQIDAWFEPEMPGPDTQPLFEEARKLGFPDIVVQGMLPVCLVSELMTGRFADGWLAGGKMDLRLVNVLWAGETVRARAAVSGQAPEAGRTRVSMQAWVEKADGTKVVVGPASALV